MSAKPPNNIKDLTGQTFNRWTVIGYIGKSYWLCLCSCGTEASVFTGNIKNGRSKSCGCFRDEKASIKSRTHGLSKSIEYSVWAGIKRRCANPNDASFKDYGARGIKMCQEWTDSFVVFLEHMGTRPTSNYEIDRTDNTRGYEPDNCRWVLRADQAVNKRNNRPVTHNGITRTISQWARITGLHQSVIGYRLNHGWSIERTLQTPSART